MKINKPTQDSQTILQSIYPNQSRLSTCSALYFLKPTTKKGKKTTVQLETSTHSRIRVYLVNPPLVRRQLVDSSLKRVHSTIRLTFVLANHIRLDEVASKQGGLRGR